MYVHNRLELLIGHPVNHAVPQEARRCYGDVEVAVGVQRELRQPLSDVRVRYGGCEPDGLASGCLDLRERLIERLLVSIVGNDVRPFFRKPESDSLADAAPSAGDDCRSPLYAFNHAAEPPVAWCG